MQWFRKRCWWWAVLVSVLAGVLLALPIVRVEYHKWRLQALKAKQERYMARTLSTMDKFRLYVIGSPESKFELEAGMRNHEEALVRLGFLRREQFVADATLAPAQVGETSDVIRGGCPWQHVEMVSGTNVVVTACAYGMAQWRKRAQEFGWKRTGKT